MYERRLQMAQLGFYSILGGLMLVTQSQCITSSFATEPGNDSVDVKHADEVATTYAQWRKGLLSEDPATREGAAAKLLPTPEDVAVLFPAEKEKMTKLLANYGVFEKVRARGSSSFARKRDLENLQSIKRFSGTNLREDDRDKKHAEILAIIPKDIPVYSVTEIQGDGKPYDVRSAFLLVNGHWIHIEQFRNYPKILKNIDRAVENSERMLKTDLKKYEQSK